MSGISPATGAESELATERAGTRRESKRARRRAAAAGPIDVRLEHARWRHFGWALGSAAVGVLLLWKLGTVGKWVGIGMCLFGVWSARSFVLTLLRAAGRIRVGESELELPRGLCRTDPLAIPVDKLRHAYFLRRKVPWMKTPPVLVVETTEGVLLYPRDWFRTDSDQQRVALALNERLGRLEQ